MKSLFFQICSEMLACTVHCSRLVLSLFSLLLFFVFVSHRKELLLILAYRSNVQHNASMWLSQAFKCMPHSAVQVLAGG